MLLRLLNILNLNTYNIFTKQINKWKFYDNRDLIEVRATIQIT